MAHDANPTANPYRLSRDVIPIRYDLTFAPDLGRRDFVGQAAVEINVAHPTVTITCNAKELDITEAWLVGADGSRNPANSTFDAEAERVTFTFERTVAAGRATLHSRFTGPLNDKLRGFYASTYTAADGTTKTIATTQLQATDARTAFPCWDEPDFKATFGITLICEGAHLAVSNMQEIGTSTLASGKRAVRFADTPVMSTYLVAMVTGELEATTPVDVDGVALRVIARPGLGHLTKFALEAGAFALRYFQEWYGIPYPGTKLDLIATPDFAFGAMENLGAVTFREMLLLADEATASRPDLERIADVISHEIAHMWFGDLVTMKWWNGIWLNEAFATFAEVSCCAKFRPEWDRWTSFSVLRAAAASIDGLQSTRPIEFEVRSPSDAEGMFDVLTYEKGASVLRQLEQFLGEDRFRDGVRHYLKSHEYSNTETTDLFDAIEHVTGEPVRSLMESWIFQGGYPIVTVERDGNELVFSQRPFTYLPPAADARTWVVPILYRIIDANGNAVRGRVLLDGESVRVAVAESAAVVVVNDGGHGFYRVRYSEALLAALRGSFVSLAPVERFQVVSDTWASVLQGTTTAKTFLELVETLGLERDVNVWTAAVGGLTALDRVFPDARREALVSLVRRVLGPIAEELSFTAEPGESSLTSELRGLVVTTLGTLGRDDSIRAKATQLVGDLLEGNHSVDPDLAPAVIAVAGACGDEALWNRYDVRRRVAAPQESVRLLQALALFPDAALVRRTLEMCLTDDVKTQDAPYAIQRAFSDRDSGPIIWAFVQEQWSQIEARYPDNAIPRMISSTSSLSEPHLAAQVHAFFGPGGHDLPQGRKQVDQTLERLRINEALRAREG